ncbi:hypothetical protein LCGC14_0882790 [marine sediment metagenome]|uniref:Uncharacterized protein n=1 Tax=marine sediment metagenome TaxID=412755 RepID=A0A0F9RKZ5_9ZZZZ
MRNNTQENNIIPIGDPPLRIRSTFWLFTGRCKKCGGELTKTIVRGRRKKVHTVNMCKHCGYSYVCRPEHKLFKT